MKKRFITYGIMALTASMALGGAVVLSKNFGLTNLGAATSGNKVTFSNLEQPFYSTEDGTVTTTAVQSVDNKESGASVSNPYYTTSINNHSRIKAEVGAAQNIESGAILTSGSTLVNAGFCGGTNALTGFMYHEFGAILTYNETYSGSKRYAYCYLSANNITNVSFILRKTESINFKVIPDSLQNDALYTSTVAATNVEVSVDANNVGGLYFFSTLETTGAVGANFLYITDLSLTWTC